MIDASTMNVPSRISHTQMDIADAENVIAVDVSKAKSKVPAAHVTHENFSGRPVP